MKILPLACIYVKIILLKTQYRIQFSIILINNSLLIVCVYRDGSNWKRMRVLLDKQMLRPRHVSSYAEDFTKVSSDFVDRLRKLRGVDTKIVDNISRELFYWSLECEYISPRNRK